MANQLYGQRGLSSVYSTTSRSGIDTYLSEPSLLGSSRYVPSYSDHHSLSSDRSPSTLFSDRTPSLLGDSIRPSSGDVSGGELSAAARSIAGSAALWTSFDLSSRSIAASATSSGLWSSFDGSSALSKRPSEGQSRVLFAIKNFFRVLINIFYGMWIWISFLFCTFWTLIGFGEALVNGWTVELGKDFLVEGGGRIIPEEHLHIECLLSRQKRIWQTFCFVHKKNVYIGADRNGLASAEGSHEICTNTLISFYLKVDKWIIFNRGMCWCLKKMNLVRDHNAVEEYRHTYVCMCIYIHIYGMSCGNRR